jgi:hypothetical protein
VKPDETIKIKEGNNNFARINVKRVDFTTIKSGLISCAPKH